MPKNEDPKFGKYFNLPNPGLRAWFQGVVRGQPDEYRTNFYTGRSLKSILDGWMPKLKSLDDKWPSLVAFEEDLAKKVGPLSIQKPLAERMDDIDSYYESILLDSKPISQEAVDAVLREWADVSRIRLRSQENTWRNMKKSTNSGSPYFQTKSKVVEKTIPGYVARGVKPDNGTYWLDQPGGTWKAAAILGWRGQEGGLNADDVKQRVVWMFPFLLNIEELRFYQPLIEAAQAYKKVPAWIGLDAVDEAITKLFDTKSADDNIVCTDFTKFDQHFNADMQAAAKTILERLMAGHGQYWFEQVFPAKYNIPLAYDWDCLRFGAHGMASGSGGTNADETLVHRALQYEAALSAGAELNPNSQCLGDDGILSYHGITVEDVVQTYSRHGQEMNLSKQYVSKLDCIYLRRWHHRDYRIDGKCVGVYSTARALGRLAEQERYYDNWSREMVALRQLSIIENCNHHPLREEFVDYCMKGDKYRLGLGIPGFFDNLSHIAKEATDYMPDFLGYSRSLGRADADRGINEWWVVKYLKSKA
nr:RNA-dependent RNA polymerase [Picobirnavirus sp.]